jgi:two-component sensor histidine kinase
VTLQRADECIVLTIWDNGIGNPEGQHLENGHGFRLTLIRGMVNIAYGDISVDNTDGVKYTLQIPLGSSS